jgi:hypothetical protein
LFEDKYKSLNYSEWYKNECLLRTLYEHSHNIFNSYENKEFTDPRDDSIEAELIRSFNSFLESCNGFTIKKQKSIETIKIRNLDVQILTYLYNGNIRGEPPSTITSFTEYEKRFRHDFELYCNYTLSVIEVFEIVSSSTKEINRTELQDDYNAFVRIMREYGIVEYHQFREHFDIYTESSEKNTLRDYRRDDLSEMSKIVEMGIESLINSIPTYIQKNVSKLYTRKDLTTGPNQSKFYDYFIRKNNVRLNSHGFIRLSNKEIVLESKNVNQLKKYFQCTEENKENAISVFYLNIEQEFKLEKSQIISIDSPETLKDSLILFYKELAKYINNGE